jgi:hypothetical protein
MRSSGLTNRTDTAGGSTAVIAVSQARLSGERSAEITGAARAPGLA